MPTYALHTNDTYPQHLAYQRQAFIRMEWIDRYVDDPDYALTLDPRSVRHDVYAQNDALVSSVSVIKTTVTLGDESFVCYGVANVMTFPFWRKRGLGGDLMDRANAFIHAQPDGDVGLLWTPVPNFYAVRGWAVVPGEPATFGDPNNPTVRGFETTMMLFLSEKAKAARSRIEAGGLYVGDRPW